MRLRRATSEADPGDSAKRAFAPGELQQRAIRGSLWTVIHTVSSVPLAFVVNAVVARVLGPADYGRLAVLTLIISIVSQVANAGVDGATVLWGASSAARGARGEVRRLLARNLGFHLAVQLPLMSIAVLGVSGQAGWHQSLAVVGSLALANALGSSALLFGIEHRTAAGAKMAMASNVGVQLAVLLSATMTEEAGWVWAARQLALAALLPLNLLALDRWGRRSSFRIALPKSFPTGFWRYSIPTATAGLFGLMVFSRSEILFLEFFDKTAALGIFALAFGVAAQITAPVDALLNPLLPAVAGLSGAHPEALKEGRNRALRAASMLSGLILATAAPVLAVALPVVYGSEFADARYPFLILAAVSCLQSACNPLLAFFNARRQSTLLLMVNLAAFLVDCILAVFLIPPFALAGALVANIGAQGVAIGLLVHREAKILKESPTAIWRLLASWLAGVVAGVSATVAGSAMVFSPIAGAALSLALGTALYATMTRVGRLGMTDGDWAALVRDLPPALTPAVKLGQWVLSPR